MSRTCRTRKNIMASCLVFLMICIVACHTVGAQDGTGTSRSSSTMKWLLADGTESSIWGPTPSEGDTVIILCESVVHSGTPLDSIEIEWLKFGSSDMVTVSEMEEITYLDGRNRFSAPNLTRVDSNTTEFRLTISNIDRYDSKVPRFFCKFNHGLLLSVGLDVIWDPPSSQCSSNVIAKAKIGDKAVYQCSSLDKDRLSAGSLAMWKSGSRLNTGVHIIFSDGSTQYNTSYTTQITDDSVQDVYMCTYTATGGFEDYNYNCTFARPDCVVEALDDPCPTSSLDTSNGAAVPSCDHHIIISTFALLLFIILTYTYSPISE